MLKFVKTTIKKFFTESSLAKLKMGMELWYYSYLMKKIESKKFSGDYLLGTPLHTNLGDHLITLSENYYLQSIDYSKEIMEIPTEMFQVYKKRLKKAIPQNAVIFINGGRWMGNLWPNEEILMEEIVSTFQNNRIIIFPQTIYYEKGKNFYNELLVSSKKKFENCSDLTLCVREQFSYDFAVEKYKNIKILLVPDIAFAYYNKSPKNSNINSNKVVSFCLREDRERCRDISIESLLKQFFLNNGYKIDKINTISKVRIPYFARERIVISRLRKFARSNFVVTDRLHGMIFSFLTRTPCIVLDNKTQKVSGVYRTWLEKCNYILPLFDKYDELIVKNFIDSFEQDICLEKYDLKFYFKILEENINNAKN